MTAIVITASMIIIVSHLIGNGVNCMVWVAGSIMTGFVICALNVYAPHAMKGTGTSTVVVVLENAGT